MDQWDHFGDQCTYSKQAPKTKKTIKPNQRICTGIKRSNWVSNVSHRIDPKIDLLIPKLICWSPIWSQNWSFDPVFDLLCEISGCELAPFVDPSFDPYANALFRVDHVFDLFVSLYWRSHWSPKWSHRSMFGRMSIFWACSWRGRLRVYTYEHIRIWSYGYNWVIIEL